MMRPWASLFAVVVLLVALVMPLGAQQASIEELRAKAVQGEAAAQHLLSIAYFNGTGVQQDAVEAVRWSRLAADQGLATAQAQTAFFYYAGVGVPQSYGEALKWNRSAAEQGIAMAQYNLAQQLAGGEGTPPDFVSAHMWANISTTRWGSMAGLSTEKQREGTELARALRAKLDRRMSPAQIADAQRLALEWDAANPRD